MSTPPDASAGKIAARIVECGEAVYGPANTQGATKVDDAPFKELLESIGTLILLPTLNTLVQPGRVQPWIRPHIFLALSHIPLRPQGVRQTIEFVLAVHPSSTQPQRPDSTTPDTRGASISLEALNAASRLLSAPPSDLSPSDWFHGIAPQLLSLLDGEGGPELIKAAAFIIGDGVLGKRKTGAPGWQSFVEPIFRDVDPSASDQLTSEEGVVDFRTKNVLVSAERLEKALRRLTCLITSHPNPGLTKRLLSQLMLPLWFLYSFSSEVPESSPITKSAGVLLKTFLQLANGGKALAILTRNLLYRGSREANKVPWTYSVDSMGKLQVERVLETPHGLDLGLIDDRVRSFITLVETTRDLEGIDELFLDMCQRWLQMPSAPGKVILVERDDPEDYEAKLVEAKLLQAMMERIPAKLVENSSQLLQLILEVLTNFIETTDGGRETVTVALSLVNFLLTSTSFRISDDNEEAIVQLQLRLGSITKAAEPEIAATARNLSHLLRFRRTEDEEAPSLAPTDQYGEDQKTYKLALSYLTSTESPPPVRVQGLDLLSNLIQHSSPVIDIPATLVLFATALQDDEEYIYLRTIEALVLLSAKHPRSVMIDLLDRFVDANEDYQLDARLRIGEALLRVIEQAGDRFHGDTARRTGESLLGVAGRRGYRPKQEKEERKRERLEERRNKEAAEAWGGEMPDFEETAGLSAADLQDNAILRGIVEGWTGRRGREDIRVRSSALAILGAAVEANVGGLGSALVGSALDLTINVLGLERSDAASMLRRSAILLVLSVVRSLDDDRATAAGAGTVTKTTSPRAGFALAGTDVAHMLDILRYVAATDGDGLVRQHASDVVESMQAAQLNDMVRAAQVSEIQTELGELRGLDVRPAVHDDENGRPRPRIEEVE